MCYRCWAGMFQICDKVLGAGRFCSVAPFQRERRFPPLAVAARNLVADGELRVWVEDVLQAQLDPPSLPRKLGAESEVELVEWCSRVSDIPRMPTP